MEEKKKLAEKLNELSAEQLLVAVDILRPSEIENSDADVIDLDFGVVEDSVLRKLSRYVDSCL
jgi:hypothetical protein